MKIFFGDGDIVRDVDIFKTSSGMRVLSGLGFFKVGERKRHELLAPAFFALSLAK
jgi:hypothetical protein